MVGQISTALASASLNIAELLNKSRGEYAYTLIDTDGSVDNTVMDKVRAIGGVLAARVMTYSGLAATSENVAPGKGRRPEKLLADRWGQQ